MVIVRFQLRCISFQIFVAQANNTRTYKYSNTRTLKIYILHVASIKLVEPLTKAAEFEVKHRRKSRTFAVVILLFF